VQVASGVSDPLVALLTRVALALRVSSAVFVTAAALLSVTAGHVGATAVALTVYDGMAVAYVLTVVRTRVLPTSLVVTDMLLVTCIALMMRALVPAASATSPAGWVFNAVSFVVIIAQFVGAFRWTVPLGGLAIAAFVVGAQHADAPDRGVTSTFTLVLQLAFAAGLTAILRAAGRRAQVAAREHHDAAREQESARLRRDAERTALTVLHNGPLTTLTLVAQGGLSEQTVTAVRAQAAIDLAVLSADRTAERSRTDTIESVQLADLLDRTAAILRHRVDVNLTTTPCVVPAAVAQAFAGATAEALENVARHAGTDSASVSLDSDEERVTVTITDTGRGFDPAVVPANRFGLRESISGELARVDGRARIASTRGEGTTITLEWPA
jgi:signal transduction histidine kinase